MNTPAVVFAGPTIEPEAITTILPDATVRGPAARGHVYRAAHDGAAAIGIIDGLYESVPAIWHKEIIYALERGIPVYGASSMGAIRAAELAPFGMIGVGSIFEEFNGTGRPDDDVAVAHGPADAGYACLSTAMVNIEEACRQALEAGLIDRAGAEAITAEARRRFYPERRLDDIAELVLGPEAGEFIAFLDRAPFDRKRADAIEMLHRMATDLRNRFEMARRPVLSRTVFFDALVRELDSHGTGSDLVGWSSPVLEELQLEPSAYRHAMLEATRRRYAREFATLNGAEPDQEAIDRASDELRLALGLLEPEQLEAWLDAVDLNWDSYAELVRRRALEKIGRAALPILPQEDLLDQARLDGTYGRLQARSAAKAKMLRESGFDESGHGIEHAEEAVEQAMTWFGAERLGTTVARQDLSRLSEEFGFKNELQFGHAVLREYRFAGTERTSDTRPRPSFDLAVMGCGMRDHWQITREQMVLLGAADAVFVPKNRSQQLLEFIVTSTTGKIVDLAEAVTEGRNRREVFDTIVERVIGTAASEGRTVLIEYGHPFLYNGIGLEVAAEAARRGLDLIVSSGVSSIDEIISVLGFDPASRNLQILHSELLLDDGPIIDPSSDVIVMRIGCVGLDRFMSADEQVAHKRASDAYERLRDRFLSVYPASHAVVAVRLDYEDTELVRRTEDSTVAFPIGRLDDVGPSLTTAHTLVVPAIEDPVVFE